MTAALILAGAAPAAAGLVAGSVAGAVAGLAGAATLMGLRRRLAVITVEGRSMEPALRSGDRVLVRRVPLDRVRRGDIVVIEQPEPAPRHPAAAGGRPERGVGDIAQRSWVIKRAAALPGDPVPAPVAAAVSADPGSPVPAGRLVALGDNAVLSFDSRTHGYYSGDRVLGVVLRRISAA
ncbi:S26 family signal peptidase [Sphaerimonospora sp. CA-214678]|uniref:S26 family signal peptidase n=1 Tax=Sphaerimonospora sp. CA-214678 TaxID=3240029 RepID=UPI003D90934B